MQHTPSPSPTATQLALLLLLAGGLGGCRTTPSVRLAPPGSADLFGGRGMDREKRMEVVSDAVARLLARHVDGLVRPAAFVAGPEPPPPRCRWVCFVGVEREEAAPAGDFTTRIDAAIRDRLLHSRAFQPVEQAIVDAGLRDSGLRPEQPLTGEHLGRFAAAMERQGRPIDFLLCARLASGGPEGGPARQGGCVLSLELIEVAGGGSDRESADLVTEDRAVFLDRWWPTGSRAR